MATSIVFLFVRIFRRLLLSPCNYEDEHDDDNDDDDGKKHLTRPVNRSRSKRIAETKRDP